LDYVCEEYNKSFHSTIGAVPWNVFRGYDGNQQMIEDIQYDVYNIGDYVVRRAKPEKDALTLVYSI
jgi:hypothetical protein